MKVLGLMASMVDLVLYCRFYVRLTQLHLLACLQAQSSPNIPRGSVVGDRARGTLVVDPSAQFDPGCQVSCTPGMSRSDDHSVKTGLGGPHPRRLRLGPMGAIETEFHINLPRLRGGDRGITYRCPDG